MRRTGTIGALAVVVGAAMALAGTPGATLLVTSEPEGATVKVDERDVGVTPVRVSGLEGGEHEVLVSKEGFLENRRRVVLPGEGAVEHRVVLLELGDDVDPGTDGAAVEGSAEPDRWAERHPTWARILRFGVPVAAALGGSYVGYRVATRNKPPVAAIRSIAPMSDGLAGLTSFRFDGSNSSDPNGDALTYSWSFGDGETAAGVGATHIYAEPGEYSVTLTVSDGVSTASTSGMTVTVGEVSASVTPGVAGIAGLTRYTFEARPASDPDGDVLSFAWTFGDGASGAGAQTTRVYDRAGTFVPRVVVRDPSSNEASVDLDALEIRSMTGTWTGTISGYGDTVEWCMELEQVGVTLTGLYVDEYGNGTVSGEIQSGPLVSITVTQPQFLPFLLQGPIDNGLTHSEGEAINYFQGGPGQYLMDRSVGGCGAALGVGDPSLRAGYRSPF